MSGAPEAMLTAQDRIWAERLWRLYGESFRRLDPASPPRPPRPPLPDGA